MRQADLSEDRGSSSDSIGESTRFEGNLECLGFDDERLELVDFAAAVALVGDASFGVDGAFA